MQKVLNTLTMLFAVSTPWGPGTQSRPPVKRPTELSTKPVPNKLDIELDSTWQTGCILAVYD